MKKEYLKPELYIEEFKLSATIASSCTIPNYNHYSKSCTFEDESGLTFFYEGACSGADIEVGGDTDIGDFCTNGPANGMVFNS